jgi:hypothetical protein
MIKLQYVGWHPPETFWIEHLDKKSKFLCKRENSIFISNLHKSRNNEYCVDDDTLGVRSLISELDEIHLLTEGKL